MKTVYRKGIVVMTCIGALQLASMVRTMEDEPQSRFSRFTKKAKDKVASIKGAATSTMKRGIKVRTPAMRA